MPDATTRIGPYELRSEVGRGGMAVIYRAYQPGLEREVAIKRLELGGGQPDLVERFLREAKLAGRLEHPNIVTVFDSFEHDDDPYIVMEYLRRGSLRPFLKHGLTAPQMIGVLEGILGGLAHAVSHGVVHRDMKPENVLVSDSGRVKIADFGIAKVASEATLATTLTQTGMALGTPLYMSPEQALAKPVGPHTDLYAVGIMAYEIVAGRTPFDVPAAPMAILLRHINEPPPPLPQHVEPRLAAWIMALLAKEPADRPADPDVAWDRLEEIAVDKLGPYWRREAALLAPGQVGPLRRTPTPPASVVALGERELEPAERAAADAELEAVPKPLAAVETPPPDAVVAADEAATAHESAEAASSYVSFELPAAGRPVPEPATAEPEPEPGPEPEEPRPEAEPEQAEPEPEAEPSLELQRPEEPRVAVVEPVPASGDNGGALSESPPDGQEALTGAPVRPREVVPEPRPAPARPTPWYLAAGAAVAVLAAAAIAYAAAPARVTRAPEPLVTNVQADGLTARVPAGWRRGSPAAAAVPGLALRDAVALRPSDGSATDAVLAGLTDTTDAKLVPGDALSALGSPTARRVRLGDQPAFQYGPADAAGARVTIYAVPTSDGVATVACRSGADGPVRRSCDAIAQSLQIRHGTPFGLPPRAALAHDVTSVATTLGRREKTHGEALARARRAPAQATSLRRLARDYGDAARAVGALSVAPFEARAVNALGAHLERLQRDARSLADAAAAGHRNRYARGRTALTRARSGLARRFKAVAAIGGGG